ncbi:MAG: hypothetical protein AAB705_02990, partial [Patescibacteria group bacterium]
DNFLQGKESKESLEKLLKNTHSNRHNSKVISAYVNHIEIAKELGIQVFCYDQLISNNLEPNLSTLRDQLQYQNILDHMYFR